MLDHLHLGHHRAAEGLRAVPPATGLMLRDRDRDGYDPRRRRRLPVPAARPCLRPNRAGRRDRVGRHDGVLRRRHAADRPRARRGQARPTCRRCRGSSRRSTRSRTAAIPAEQIEDGGAPWRPASSSTPASSAENPSRRSCARPSSGRGGCSSRCQAFGGRVREATTGAAPIAPEILEFFYAAGVPVMEGYGMTESTGVGDRQRAGPVPLRHGRRAVPGVEVKIAEDGEMLMRGAARLRRATGTNPEATAEVARATAGCTPATSASSTRTATCRSPAARRTSSSPPAARTSRRPTSRTSSSSPARSPRP